MSGILSNTLASTRFLKSSLFFLFLSALLETRDSSSNQVNLTRQLMRRLRGCHYNLQEGAIRSLKIQEISLRIQDPFTEPQSIWIFRAPLTGPSIHFVSFEQDQMKQSFYRDEPKLKPDQCSEWRMQLSTFYVKSFVVKERLRNFCVYQVPGQRWKSGIWRI